ncbi:MAG: methyltransferase domain-containing protein [Alphaproteobacteria bacterium]|nr:methyltransferase domain-containing protein [Alphaproteobacteria bacterium]
MPDIYVEPDAIPAEILDQMKVSLERRAATPQQAAALRAYLADIDMPDGARVLDVGCGTGPQSRTIAGLAGVGEVVGVDQLEPFLERARELAADLDNVSFRQADARALPFDDASFDVVVLHTLLTHVPGPEDVLADVHRVLRPGGQVAIYDGDFTTMTVATSDADPLQACIDAFVEGNVHDRWLVRRLPTLLREAGFEPGPTRSHGHLDTEVSQLTRGWTERGALYMRQWGRIDAAMEAALVAECARRIDEGTFYGFMNYVSILARKT